jgi:hypothetical protein
MMTTPPTVTLPEEIERAMTEYRVQVRGNWSGLGEYAERKAELHLRATISAALAEQWYDGWQQAILDHGHQDEASLRERAERLRREFIQRHAHDYRNPSTEELERFYGLQPGDLADDLVPKTT